MTPAGFAQLKADEGCRLTAYPDPITKDDPWTIGYGQTGPMIERGTVWTQTQADTALSNKVADLEASLDEAAPWWRNMNAARQDAVVNLAYNLGVAGLMGFHQTIAALRVRNYALAAQNLLTSKAAQELPKRYARLAKQLATGVASA